MSLHYTFKCPNIKKDINPFSEISYSCSAKTGKYASLSSQFEIETTRSKQKVSACDLYEGKEQLISFNLIPVII